MRKNLFQKLKNKKGYTLTEMIVVVGIIVILLGISMIGVAELSKNLKMAELDDYAKIIYLEAQEQLSLIEVEGGTDAYYEQIRSTYPKITEGEAGYNPRFFKEEIYAVDEYVSDYPLGSTDAEKVLAKKMWEHMCYLTKSDPLSKKMIFETSDIYLNGGSYLIEFNPTTGDIYGVFYWENSADMSYKNDIMALATRERADRKAKQIGYYGGELAGDFVEEESILQNVTLINGEELYLKLSFDKEEAVKALDENRLSVVVDITGERNNTVRFDTIDLRVNNDATGTDTMDFYMLLDSMMEGHRFNNIVNAGKTGDEQVITPGENLTIKVTSTFKDATTGEIRKREKTVRGNSLFANNTTTSQIGISALRHMMNLNGSVYDADKFTDRNLIQYISNVDFAEDAYAWGIDGFNNVIYKKYGLGEHPLTYINPIQNEKLFKTGINATGASENRQVTSAGDGVRYVLKNFIVEPVKSAEGVIEDKIGIGIFGEIQNTDFSKIYVENATVNAEGCDNVGALIGRLENGGILDCGVYLQTSGVKDGVLIDYPVAAENGTDGHKYLMEHYYDTYRIKGNNNVGGLIGKAEANTEVIIKNAFAATKVDGVSNVGGLIGYVETTSDAGIYVIKQSYASGDVSGQSYVGGFAGGIKSFTSGKILVENNYTTGNVSGTQTFGGFLGQTQNVIYKDCISYGKLLKLGAEENKKTVFVDADNIGGFVYAGASSDSSYADCVYMSQVGYNKSLAMKDPSTTGLTTKEYGSLMSTADTAVKVSYPYANMLHMQLFPFKKLEEQTSHYGDWATRFVIDTSLVYYEKYEDGSYGYYCVTTAEDNEKLWLLDTLEDKACKEDGYGLLTKYKLKEISYEVYIGNTDRKLEATLPVNERTDAIEGDTYTQAQFLYLNKQGSLTFKEIESYDEERGEVVGEETGESFDVESLYLYQLPYELQCAERDGVPYFYDRIIFDAVADGGSNKKVIEDAAYLYNPHFAKTAYNPNVSEEPVDITTTTAVSNPVNVYVRSARQLNALGRYPYYWNTRHGYRGQQINYLQETDVNFSTYTKVYGGRNLDLQAFGEDHSNRPIGNPELSAVGEADYAGAFKNNYDGQNNKIIDYCVDVSDVQFVGLFGEIQGATLQNIVMVMSPEEDRQSVNAGIIRSDFKTWTIHKGDYSGNLRRRIMRTAVGALLGMAYDNSYSTSDNDISNTIRNCVSAGYTVQYHLSNEANPNKPDDRISLDPMGIVVGGLIGYGESDITNCSAVNDVQVVLDKDYDNSFDYYTYTPPTENNPSIEKYEKNKDASKVAGGIVNVGGFVGSYFYNKVENCYSGGTIDIINNGDYTIPNLRIGNFCPGWLDTRAYGLNYKDYQDKDPNTFKSFQYVNCYTYTMVYDNVFDVKTKDMNYVPFASNKVDFYDEGEGAQTWLTEEVIPEQYTTFRDVYYVDELSMVGMITESKVYGESVSCQTLAEVPEGKNANKAIADRTYLNAVDKAGKAYPYQEVIKDANGNFVHYGKWYSRTLPESALTYYEKYEDGSYGYYCVTADVNGKNAWILDTLKDEACIEDGYAVFAKYELDALKYKKHDEGDDKFKSLAFQKVSVEGWLRFKGYEDYNATLGNPVNALGMSVNGTDTYLYLYKLPVEFQNMVKSENYNSSNASNSYYNRYVFRGEIGGVKVLKDLDSLYNPRFAKTALNLTQDGYNKLVKPTNIYIRSARQLNLLGRNRWYWRYKGGRNKDIKVTYIQETDINFSIYVKNYMGQEFDLQAFGEKYSNMPIGQADYNFTNNYNGQGNAIIDYCVGPTYYNESNQVKYARHVALFGEIQDSTIENVVMLVSSNPTSENAGLITGGFRTNTGAVNNEMLATSLGALVGQAYEDAPYKQTKNTIRNCAASGYTIKYVLQNTADSLDPFAISMGGLVGLSASNISNSTAENDLVIELKKSYTTTGADDGYGGVAYMGGFVGSQKYADISNCYSGGTIKVLNKNQNTTYEISKLRVGGFCPGWLDTRYTDSADGVIKGYKDYITSLKKDTNMEVSYTNIYSYTEISDTVWGVPNFTHYVPLVSNLVEYPTWTDSASNIGWEYSSVQDDMITFEGNYYVERLSVGHLKKTPSDVKAHYMEGNENFTAEGVSFEKLKTKAVNEASADNTYIGYENGQLVSSEIAYPYQAVVKKVDADGNLTNEYVHYGEWLDGIDNTLAYYEKYSETEYGYYSLVTDPITGTAWILDTLQDRVAIEDGYGLLTEYTLGSLSYDLYVANKGTAVPGTIDVSTLQSVSGLNFEVNDGAVRKVVSASNLTNFYKLPFERQFTERNAGDGFYDLIVFNANERGTENENGKEVITQFASLYNPHFAKAVKNLEAVAEDTTPSNVYVRSARQLNALGRNDYYWSLKGGNNNQKVTFVQENDINFSDYAYVGEKEDGKKLTSYLGQEFDLQDFKKDYANHVIGESYGTPFTNIYDGRSNRIIDYCLDGGETTHFTGLFGEIKNATLKNIVMVVSSNPKGGGVITSSYRTRHNATGDGEGNWRKRENRVGLGALLGMANNDWGKNTIENCVASGYTVKYVLINRPDTIKPLDNFVLGNTIEPLGVAIGGLIGYSVDNISNCAAVNDVVVELEKDYIHTYDNYYNYNRNNGSGTGGVVYMGGFIGSFFKGKVNDCYSGGSIDIIDNGYRIPQLRVASFCPGWIDTAMNTLRYKDYEKNGQDYRSFEYVNVYSYTDISAHIWEVDTETTHYIPLVSRLVDYFDRGINNQDDDEKWIHNEMIPGIYAGFTNNYYLQEFSKDHLMQVEGDENEIPKKFYLQNGENAAAASQITRSDLKNKAESGIKANKTYLTGELAPSSTVSYPYPAVIREVDEKGNLTDTYVHYGDWYDRSVNTKLASKYPTYFEIYADGTYGFSYVDEAGITVNTLTKNHAQEITSTGYGYLTTSSKDANVDNVNITIGNTTYYLEKMEPNQMYNAAEAEQKEKYVHFKMTYYSAETGNVLAENVDIYMNAYFGAALSGSSDLGTKENPFQVRTKEHFERVATLTRVNAKDSFIKQTHDVDLQGVYASSYEPTYEEFKLVKDNGITMLDYYMTYDGSYEELGCVIKNAAVTPFAINNGLIQNTKVDSYDSSAINRGSLSGFVFDNIGTIENCSVNATVIKADCAYGFVIFNAGSGVVRNCSVNGILTGTEEAVGFVADNRGMVEKCNVNATITARDTFGFAEMNKQNATIKDCEARVKATATKNTDGNDRPEDNLSILDHNGLAAGFMEQNAGLVSGCKVYLDATHSISSTYIANGFAYINFGVDRKERKDEHGNTIIDAEGKVQYDVEIKETGTIEDCHVVSDGNGSVAGIYAYGFVYKNPNLVVNDVSVDARITGSSVIGRILGDKEAAGFAGINEGEITLSKVGKADSNVITTIQAREPAGFVFENSGEVDKCHVNANVESTTNEHRAFGFTYANKPGGQITDSSVTGTVKAKLAYGFVLKNNEDAAAGITATIDNCSVNATVTGYGAENMGAKDDDGVEAAGFCDRNYPGGQITNCSVLGTIQATMVAKDPFGEPFAQAYSEAVGFIDVNKGTVTSCTVGNSNQFVTVIGDDAAGFVEKNEDGASISGCSVVAKVTATGNGVDDEHGDKNGTASGFAEHNKAATITSCTVYLVDRDGQPAIKGSREAYGFAEKNEGTISTSKVIATGNATIEGRDKAVGFVKDNGSENHKKNAAGITTEIVKKSGKIEGCKVGDIAQSGVITIQAHKAYGFTDVNFSGPSLTDCSKITKSSVIANVKAHTTCNELPCDTSETEAIGFVNYNYGSISECKVGDKDYVVNVHAHRAYGFAKTNYSDSEITGSSVIADVRGHSSCNTTGHSNCHVLGVEALNVERDHVTCNRANEEDDYEREATGFVRDNYGTITTCHVGDTTNKVLANVEARDAYGFAEKNKDGGSITSCTVFATIRGTNQTAGFIEENGEEGGTKGAVISGSTVYLKDSSENTPAIYSKSIATGFATENIGEIQNCSVQNVETGSIVGEKEADGFVRENGKQDTNDDETEVTKVSGVGTIINCNVGDKTNSEGMIIKGEKSYGFAKVNCSYLRDSNGEALKDSDGRKIESRISGCNVVAQITTFEDVSSPHDTDAAYGMVGTNWGYVGDCQVGALDDTAKKVKILIKGTRAYGFCRENRGSFFRCSVVGTGGTSIISTSPADLSKNYNGYDTGLAIGFVSDNFGGIDSCYVRAVNGYKDVLIQGVEAYGFVKQASKVNGAYVSRCFAVATVEGQSDAAGFAKANKIAGGIVNCYANTNASVSLTDDDAKVSGFIYDALEGHVTNCYACGSISGYNTYGFVRKGYAEDCYTVVSQTGTDTHGFKGSTGGTDGSCYWGYDNTTGLNWNVKGDADIKKTLQDCDNEATDTPAQPFTTDLNGGKYPYKTYYEGQIHYGDWPEGIHVNLSVNAEDYLRAGLYYCEVYKDPRTGKITYGTYAVGDFHNKVTNVRSIGVTVNTLMQADAITLAKYVTERYYGVYYHEDIDDGKKCHDREEWTPYWYHSFDGGQKSLFKDLDVTLIPEGFGNYRFCKMTEAVGPTEEIAEQATATIYYQTYTNTDAKHTDNNYDALYATDKGDMYEIVTDSDDVKGIKLTITMDEIEAARFSPSLNRPTK